MTAMLLAADGHEVVVLERDPAPPPDPADAWHSWERRGVNQFRLPHFLLPRFNTAASAELPAVTDGLRAAGAYAFNVFHDRRDHVPGGERFDALTARRPVLEAVVAAAADAAPRVEVRRGVAVQELVTGPPSAGGVPHVVGVRTEDGSVIFADLVVVATGRRSALPGWLGAIGARPTVEEMEDSGFVYYGRYVQSRDGSPVVPGPMLVQYGSVSVLALPGDNGTAGIGLIGWSEDTGMRRLRHNRAWEAVMRALPASEPLLDTEPISPLAVMAGIEDRWRRLVVDGQPVATGIVAVADAWAATNPTLGRGISLGLLHAIALRDLLRDASSDDPTALAMGFDEVTQRDFTPWYRSTVWHDRHRVAEIQAAVTGQVPAMLRDPSWVAYLRFNQLASTDLQLAVLTAECNAGLYVQPEDVVADPEVAAKLGDDVALPAEAPGTPPRSRLLELVTT